MQILCGDALEVLFTLPDNSVHCVVTSPPYYGLRDYGIAGQLGLESTIDEYLTKMVAIFAEVRRVLHKDGTCWLNLGDSYNTSPVGHHSVASLLNSSTAKVGNLHESNLRASKTRTIIRDGYYKPKDLLGIPWRVAFGLQADGWYLRQDIIWHKPNPLPESVKDRCTKSHEYIFLLTKSAKYYYDAKAIREKADKLARRAVTFRHGGDYTNNNSFHNSQKKAKDGHGDGQKQIGRNRHSVWTFATQSYKGAHFATFPIKLPELCIKAGCPHGGLVLDPFSGAGTTGLVALRLGRDYLGIELNPAYVEMSQQRIKDDAPLFYHE